MRRDSSSTLYGVARNDHVDDAEPLAVEVATHVLETRTRAAVARSRPQRQRRMTQEEQSERLRRFLETEVWPLVP